jgi:3-deoxy-D-manno-octulosonic-acid transferase
VVAAIRKDNRLEFVSNLKMIQLSGYREFLAPKTVTFNATYINTNKHAAKFIIAPNIKPEQINELKTGITRKTIFFWKHEGKDLSDYDVLVAGCS